MKSFEAEILTNGKGGCFVEIPFNVEEEYGKKGQVKIKANFDGISYRGSLAKMGHPCHILLIRKDIREQIGKGPGDIVQVKIKQDTEERVVVVPDDLQQLLDQDQELLATFNQLSYTNRKEYALWIKDAKREATRVKRLEATIEKLKKGLKNPFDKG